MTRKRRRIVVAVDTSAGSRAALRLAAVLARRLDAELTGLFVQDQNLIHLASLPFARELSASAGVRRALSAEIMERELARQARSLEQELEKVAMALDIRWTFQTRRGRVIPEILAASIEHELLALGRTGMRLGHRRLGSTARRLLAEAGLPILLIGSVPSPVERVMAVFDSSPSSEQALRRALELTPEEQSLHVLVWAEKRADLASLESRLARLAGGRALEIYLRVGGGGRELIDWVSRIGPTMLVVGQLGQLEPAALEALAERLDGAVLRIREPAAGA
ncbi:MAG: universal stress protein [Wenzhouxiangellaceae bacterium]|nr:universal stress protein [Wenzhouxiangellaceae bacterium]